MDRTRQKERHASAEADWAGAALLAPPLLGHVSRWPWSLREMSADAEVALLRGGRTEEREDGTLCPRPQLSAFPQPRLQRPKDLRLWAVPAHRRLSAAGRQLAGERETDRERDEGL